MKRRPLSQPSKRRSPATRDSARGATTLNQKVVLGRTVIEVIAGQLVGLRGVVLATSPARWSIQLEGIDQGVMLSIHPKWVRIVPAE
jgi:hypothetical protein